MSEVYSIKPDNRSLRVFEGIEAVSFSFPLTELLEEAQIQEILVDTKAATWKITLLLKNELSPPQVKELEEALPGLVLGLSKVKLELVYCKDLPPLSERVERYWDQFVVAAGDKFPGIGGWLSIARYRLSGQSNLEIEVSNKMGVDYLKDRALELAELLRELVLEEIKLSFLVGDFSNQLIETQLQREQAAEVELENLMNVPAVKGATKKAVNPEVFYGKRISGELVTLQELTEERDQVIVYGQICRFESRLAKSGRKFYLGDLTNFQDSIGFKIFPRGAADGLEQLQEGQWVTLRGNLEFDPYARELVLQATDINAAKAIIREDLAEVKRIELHLHTKMSAMDATVDVTEAIKQAAAWGHQAVAITDHGVVQAYPEAFQAAKKAGIKVIYGLEGYLVDDGAPIVVGATQESLAETTYVVFDFETTGFNPWQEDLLEIGAVKLKAGTIIEEFHSLIKPGKAISDEIQKLTGITPEMVATAPEPQAVLSQFLEFCETAVLVAHNAQFDIGFLKAKAQQLLDLKLQPVFLDTLTLARSVWPHFKSYRLNQLAKELEVKLVNHHRAVDDARCTAQIMLKAYDQIANRGFTRLVELNSLIKEGSLEHLRTYHIIMLVKDQTGLRNLYRLVSESHLQHFHRHPRIPRSRLSELREGLLLGTACEAGEFFQAMIDGATEDKLLEMANFYDYLEIQPLDNNLFLLDSQRVKSRDDLMDYNRRICKIARQLGKTVVATGDVHFLHPHQEIFRRILQIGQGYDDANRRTPLYLRTTAEMLEEFNYLGPDLAQEVVVANPQKIASLIADVHPVPEKFFPPQIPGAAAEIREMAYQQAKELYGEPLPGLVAERLEWELNSIINHGYAVLYLIAHKLVKKSLDDGYLVGSRGSVGSSFVATMCKITEVNPLPAHYRCPHCRYSEFTETGSIGSGFDLPSKDCPSCGGPLLKDGQDIPFATFMGFEGDKEPDIDLNFSGDYQAKVHRYTEELFGKGFVFRAGTITGLADKMAFGFVRGYMEDSGVKLRQAEINRLVKGCTGVRRSTGQHPGGMVVVPQDQDIYNFTPIQFPANDKKAEWVTTHFDFHGALEGRLVKLDILGHDDPTVIRMLHDLTGIDPRTVPLDDPQTMKLFSAVTTLGITAEALGFDLGTLGIPEFGTGFVRQMLAETRPTTFSELLYISGLSHGTNVWLGNAQDLVKNGQAKLAEVISTRDDIMNHLIFKGIPPKTSFKIMEKVRKGKGLEDEDIQIMKENQIPNWYIESCQKIKYMFPKAHAAAYVMMAFRIAYYKVHYHEAFYTTYFSVRADEFDAEIVVQGQPVIKKTLDEIKAKGNEATQREKNLETILEVVLEAILRGIKFQRVDIYQSDPQKFIITPEGLLPPLASLQGLGDNAAAAVALARANGDFISVEDLKIRAHLSSAVIEVLQKHGCLNGLSQTDQLELFPGAGF